ncbi:MAG: carbohydrate-binding domain-containing protein, partial [Prevotella sp.]|nr:carbohydrate-binding domain-containing protein [Prevotella sp.]
MKRIAIIFCSIFCATVIFAQSMNVNIGEVTYVHKAANTGEMLFSNGTTLTIEGKTYTISDINDIVIDNTTIDNNAVNITYNGTSAKILVAGNIAKYLTITANGSNISIIQDANLAEEITYSLSGSSSNGSFYMDGDYKATLALNNLTLTNTNGAAIDIENGKRIAVVLSGTNTLTDCSNGNQNACFYIDGHPEFTGTGSLIVTGNTKHGITSGDYMLIESGTINVQSAVSDGLHVEQYFKMDGGNITIQATGDGIDCGFKGVNKGTKDTYENNGFIFINNGILNIISTGDASKGLKCDSSVVVTGGNVNITTSGAAYYEASENDISSSSALKCDGSFTMSNGTINLLSTG